MPSIYHDVSNTDYLKWPSTGYRINQGSSETLEGKLWENVARETCDKCLITMNISLDVIDYLK